MPQISLGYVVSAPCLVSRLFDWLRAAMLDVSVDLGSIKVTGMKPRLSLTLSSSFTITLPPSWPGIPTADELRQASAAGEIWISKAGSCQIEVVTSVNDKPPDSVFEPSVMAAVASLASECTAWKHIGLELRVNHASYARPDQSYLQASYFLHHPDLSSEMIAPANVPSARFQGLRCEANYRLGSPQSKTKTPRQAVDPLNSDQHAPEAPSQHTYGLRSNPKRSRKAAVAQEEIDDAVISPPPSSNFTSELVHEDMESLVPEAMIAEMADLLDFAFRKLIGIRKASPGLRTIKRTPSPSLIDIAPAVWNLQYIQAMTAHAQIIPSIATGIARLRNAQSPTLREKLDRITRNRESNGQKPLDAETHAADEFGKRLWLLCQTRIQPEHVNGPQARRKTDRDMIKEPPSQMGVSRSVVFEHGNPPDQFDAVDAGGDLVDLASYELTTEYNPYAMLPEEALYDPDFFDVHDLPHANELYEVDDGSASSGDWTGSSEANYFYTDGHGNVYPVETHDEPETDETRWHWNRQMIEPEDFIHEEDATQTYIMYHEEDWLQTSETIIQSQNAPGQPLPLSYRDPTPPLIGWTGQ